MDYCLKIVRACSLIGFACFFAVQVVSAAALTSVSDEMSRQRIAVESNHEFFFKTPSGVDAPGDTITVTFAAGFDLSGLGFGDVDFFHGPLTGLEVEEVLGAVAAGGVWGVTIAGQTLTLTPPTDAALGEIGAGDSIVLRIGTNAVGGLGQIDNPGSVGRHQITIGGLFGDSSALVIPIVANDSMDISATVTGPPSQGAGGGGGGGTGIPAISTPSATSTPSISISNARSLHVTTSSADIVWTTSTSTDSRIDYGQTVEYASGTRMDAQAVTDHTLSLDGLSPGTIYRVLITSRQTSSGVSATTELVFSTRSIPSTLLITNPRTSVVTDSSITILWETSIEASSIVEYGTSTTYGSSITSGSFVRNHALTIPGLSPDTTYFFRILGLSPDGTGVTSASQTIQTPADQTPPTNASQFQANPEVERISLQWVNPADPDFRLVEIRARTDRAPASRTDGRFVYQGSATNFLDRSLSPALRYFYTLFAVDDSGNASSGALADAVPLASTSTVSATSTPQLPTTDPVTSLSPTSMPPPVGPALGLGGTTSTAMPPPPSPAGVTSTTTLPPDGGSATGTIITLPTTGSSGSSSTEPSSGISATVTTSTLPSDVPATVAIFPSYFAYSGSLELRPESDGVLGGIVGQPLLVRLPIQGLPSIRSAELRIEGGSAYRLTLSPQRDAFIASFLPRSDAGQANLVVHTFFDDGRISRATSTVLVRVPGQVREGQLIDRSVQPVSEALVTLYIKQGGVFVRWSPTSGQVNPIKTDAAGRYAYIVPSGEYRLIVRKEGYKDKMLDVRPDHHLIVSSIELFRLPKALGSVVRAGASFQENLIAIAEEVETAIGFALDTVQTPDNQAVAEQVVTPVVVTIAVANTATAVSAFSLLNYLHFLFTQPLLLLKRRKRDKWGVVYNALTKQPIDLAIVRLMRAKTRMVVQTRITDAQGRYSFMAQPGEYLVEVIKPNVIYPSKLLQHEHIDTDFVDLYHGESIQVKNASVLTMNIPVDPVERVETPHMVLRKQVLRKIQNYAGLVGIGASIFVWAVSPTWMMVGFIVLQAMFYLLFRRLALPPKPKDWGIIYEDTTRKTLEHVIVRIFDKKYNKLLETQVTDSHGRYGFVVGKNTYYVVADKTGYERYRSSDLDLTKEAYGTIDYKISLKKANKE